MGNQMTVVDEHTAYKKTHQNETLGQAQVHTRYTGLYEQAGLCIACAAQAAYGHQLGFAVINAPCEACQPVVDGFPVAKTAPWRAHIMSQWGDGPAPTLYAEKNASPTAPSALPAGEHQCRCGKTYRGSKVEHCMGCHETFGGTVAGDRHRVGEHGVYEGENRRRCLDHDEMIEKGLVLKDNGVWSLVYTGPGA